MDSYHEPTRPRRPIDLDAFTADVADLLYGYGNPVADEEVRDALRPLAATLGLSLGSDSDPDPDPDSLQGETR